jgi:superfamily II DNA/RNA helicase
MLVKFEEEDKKNQTEPIIDIDALSIEAGKKEAEREKEKYTPTEEDLKKLEEVLLTPSKTPQNASEMMITTDEDIINSIPDDEETSDWDVTLMDGLEDEEISIKSIHQRYVQLEKEEDKRYCLVELLETISVGQAFVFANSKERTEYIFSILTEAKFPVALIHGMLPQRQRDQIMKDFRSGTYRILITTDLLARGIDIQSVSLVINYDLPIKLDNYIHRIGRCGRYGRDGLGINFIVHELSKLREIEKFYAISIQPLASLENISRGKY